MFSVLRSWSTRPLSRMPARCSSRSARAILDDDDTPVDLSEDNDAVDGKRPRPFRSSPSLKPTPAAWKAHRASLKETFPAGWDPPRKLSREAMDGLRQLHRANPAAFPTRALAERFRVSPEAVRRILKSSWAPPPERATKLRMREAALKKQGRSLSALRERLEAQRVGQSKADSRAAMRMEWDLMEDAEEGDPDAEPTKGIHPRDRLAFE